MRERNQSRLTRTIKLDRRVTIPQIAADFNAGPPTSVTMRTIKRNIIDMGFWSRRPTLLPLLTARHKALLLAWARQQQHWTVYDWKHVVWSDESRFQLNLADGRIRVWRQPHESMDPICQQGTVQADGGSVMIWGVCS
ncbi:HTH_Tnp_Tc3_2 domain-containing protein [Trichonephila clavipes]|nr:HTH_Tnp_Tc3_2 domain-containing protein [Trichonephila clavipes]